MAGIEEEIEQVSCTQAKLAPRNILLRDKPNLSILERQKYDDPKIIPLLDYLTRKLLAGRNLMNPCTDSVENSFAQANNLIDFNVTHHTR